MSTQVQNRSSEKTSSGRSSGKATVLIALMAIVLIGIFAVGYFPRIARARVTQSLADTHDKELIEVSAAPVTVAAADAELVLPGNIQAITEAPIFARTDGYVVKRIADIGDKVKKGQLLTEIDSPEVNQQLQQARASLEQSKAALAQSEAAVEQAKARAALAAVTMGRWKELVAKGILSKQDGDEKEANYNTTRADVAAAEANVKASRSAITASEANVARLQELQTFQKIVAPYDGMITRRNVVTGGLITAGSNSSIQEMYRITVLDPLKIMVNVPQSAVQFIHVGQQVEFTVQEMPGRTFNGRVERTANSLEAASRTLSTEIWFHNPKWELLPGMYAEAKFKTRRDNPPLQLPGDAVMTGKTGPRVAVLAKGNRVHYQSVQIGRDYGAVTEILSGVQKNDLVVLNPTDEIREGMQVKVLKETSGK